MPKIAEMFSTKDLAESEGYSVIKELFEKCVPEDAQISWDREGCNVCVLEVGNTCYFLTSCFYLNKGVEIGYVDGDCTVDLNGEEIWSGDISLIRNANK